MAHYMQLLGTDVPNSYGGVCYFGPIDHPAFQNPTENNNHHNSSSHRASQASSSHARMEKDDANCVPPLPISHVVEAYCAQPHKHTNTASSGASGSEGYLFFNCPEGVQRFSSEANIKLGRAKGFLFTRMASSEPPLTHTTTTNTIATTTSASALPSSSSSPCQTGPHSQHWFEATRALGASSAVMGLPGLLFTINDAGVQNATLFGPSTCCHAQHEVPAPVRGAVTTRYTNPTAMRTTCAESEKEDDEATLVPETSQPLTHAMSSYAPSGVERVVVALRKHYFTHRPMRFCVLCPTLVPPCSEWPAALPAAAVRETAHRILGNARCQAAPCERPMQCLTDTPAYKAILPNLYSQDRLFPLATPAPILPDTTTTAAASTLTPFIVSVVQLSAQSLLIAFRVSGGEAQVEQMPAVFSSSWHAQHAQSRETAGGNKSAASFEWFDTSDLVLSYAIVHAPSPAFDAQRARALGVRPGKKFGELKEGHAVEVDVVEGNDGGDKKSNKRERTAITSQQQEQYDQQPDAHSTPPQKRTREDTITNADSHGNGSPFTSSLPPPLSTPSPPPPPPSCSSERRMVQPWEVMRDTVASRHIYLSLVLDGDHPRDVQSAVHRLIDTELEAILVHWSPRLAFCTHQGHQGGVGQKSSAAHHEVNTNTNAIDDEEEEEEKKGTRRESGAPPLRTLVLRHAMHVQPRSYFSGFAAWQKELAVDTASASTSTRTPLSHPQHSSNPMPQEEDVYTAYTHFLFDGLTVPSASTSASSSPLRQNVRLSTAPSLFTRSTPRRKADAAAGSTAASSSVPLQITQHVFSSEVSEAYTAYPTALAHRYHLHLLAPFLFPMKMHAPSLWQKEKEDQDEETETETRTGEETTQQQPCESRADGDGSTHTSPDMWPYSYKLRCIPEESLRWWTHDEEDQGEAQGQHKVSHDTIRRSSPSAAKPQPPPQQQHPSTKKKNQKNASLTRSADHLENGAGLIRYPTAESAVALLTKGFRARERAALRRLSARFSPRPSASTITAEKSFAATDDARAPEVITLQTLLTTQTNTHTSSSCSSAAAQDGALVFLGTGSAVPSKHRNVSGTFLELHLPAYCFGRRTKTTSLPSSSPATATTCVMPTPLARGIVILDFGECNSGQLASLLQYGRQRLGTHGETLTSTSTLNAQCDDGDDAEEEKDDALAQFLRDVVLVFISHAHADHHLGLTTLLSLRHFYRSFFSSASSHRGTATATEMTSALPPLLVVCPQEVYEYVMDTWGCETPYKEWLQKDVVFDCMPGAFSLNPHLHTARQRAAEEEEEEEAEEEEEEEKKECEGAKTAHADTNKPYLTSQPSMDDAATTTTTETVAAVGDPMRTRAVPELTVPACLPQLAALFQSWNQNIAQSEGIRDGQTHHRWWDADVFTVDHPANAHALLLRFPCLPKLTHSAITTQHAASTLPLATCPSAQALTSRVFLFSGDTRPCRRLVAHSERFCDTAQGERVAICLHEATFGPGYELEAARKKHSTLPEALRVGRQWLGAESIVLNHFSQRYPKLPGLTEAHLGGSAVDLQCRRRGGGVGADTKNVKNTDINDGGMDENVPDTRAAMAHTASHQPQELAQPAAPEPADPSPLEDSAERDMCFAFDLMRLSFAAMESGAAASLTSSFVRLLEEYESWTSGTTQRLRE